MPGLRLGSWKVLVSGALMGVLFCPGPAVQIADQERQQH